MYPAYHVSYLMPGDAVKVTGFDDLCCIVEESPEEVLSSQVYVEYEFGSGMVVNISDITQINMVDVTDTVEQAARIAVSKLSYKGFH